jgi:hypothetical protein
MRLIQSPVHSKLGAPTLGVERPGCEAEHSSPFSAEVKNVWRYTGLPHTFPWRGA